MVVLDVGMKIELIDLHTDDGLKGLNLSFGLHGVSLLLDPQELISGAILRALAGLNKTGAGKILIDGMPIDEYRIESDWHHNFGYIFAEGIMLANLSLSENIFLPLRWRTPNISQAECDKLAEPWLQLFGVEMDLNIRPADVKPSILKFLSYTRSLILKPKYLLIDSPYYQLNKMERKIMFNALSQLRDTHKMLIASSDDDFAGGFSDELVEL